MRWIFFTLLVVNIAALAWGMVVTSNAPVKQAMKVSSTSVKYKGVPEVVMLSELSESSALLYQEIETTETQASDGATKPEERVVESISTDEPEKSVSHPAAGRDPERPVCEMVGPFKNMDGAKVLVERLDAIEIQSDIRHFDLPAGMRYQVYLPPLPTKEEAFRKLAELQANGVDSYVIRKGELANSVSLGLFRKKSFAESHVKRLKGIGLDPKIEVIEDTVRELWVVLKQGEGLKMSSLTWKNTMEGIDFAERRKNYCLGVASGEKFL